MNEPIDLPINLADLVPKESTFTLSTYPDKPLTLCRWTLRVRAWATEKYTPEGINRIFSELRIAEIADLAWFMLKDDCKKIFNDKKDDFLDAVSSVKDQTDLITALLAAVGIGEPEMKKIKDAVAPKGGEVPDPQLSSPIIGAKPSTP